MNFIQLRWEKRREVDNIGFRLEMFEKFERRNIIILDGLDYELGILFLEVIMSIGNDVIDILIVDDTHLRPNNTSFAVWSSTEK